MTDFATIRLRRLLAFALVVLAMTALTACGDDGDDAEQASDEPTIVEPSALEGVADRLDHPIYWVGERDGTDYELTESEDRVYVRYLDEGTEAGARSAKFLTVGTYQLQDPVAALRRAAKDSRGAKIVRGEDDAVVLIDPSRPTSTYLAYPGKDQQIEIYSPDAEEALRLARGGHVEAIE